MSITEKILNLDSELMALETKAFVKKEEMKASLNDLKEDLFGDDVEKDFEDDEYFDDEYDEDDEDFEEEEGGGVYESYFDRVRRKSEKIFEENRIRNEKEAAERKRKIEEIECSDEEDSEKSSEGEVWPYLERLRKKTEQIYAENKEKNEREALERKRR